MRIQNRKGLSAIIATLLIILLTLVAVGIIWVVIRNVVQGGAEQIDLSQKCIAVDLSANAASCDGTGICSVTYNRAVGGDDVAGVKIILSNGLTSFTHPVPGNIAPFDQKTEANIATGLSPEPNSVQIAAYFLDASGNEQLCNPTGELPF